MWRDRGQGAHGELLPQEAPGWREAAVIRWRHQGGGGGRPPHPHPHGGPPDQQDDAREGGRGERSVLRKVQARMILDENEIIA